MIDGENEKPPFAVLVWGYYKLFFTFFIFLSQLHANLLLYINIFNRATKLCLLLSWKQEKNWAETQCGQTGRERLF